MLTDTRRSRTMREAYGAGSRLIGHSGAEPSTTTSSSVVKPCRS
jgi:hypothetical protein